MLNLYSFPPVPLPNFTEFLTAEGAFTPEEVDKINQLWSGDKSHAAELEGKELQVDNLRKSTLVPIHPNEDNRWIFDKMSAIIGQSNQYYQFDLNGFYEPLQIAEYSVGDFFDWHLDFGVGHSSTRKLSMTIQLSDPESYEGGDLEFHINQNEVKAPRSIGTVIVFPSFIRHRVTPITKGTRRSIVGWVSGPPYR